MTSSQQCQSKCFEGLSCQRLLLAAISYLSWPLTGDTEGIELDEDGWQKLPLYVELDMLQQAAHGSDGAAPLPATFGAADSSVTNLMRPWR